MFVFPERLNLKEVRIRAREYRKRKKKPNQITPPIKHYHLHHLLKILHLQKSGRKAKNLSGGQEEWLIEYLEPPEMTYTTPRRKDNLYIEKINGVKIIRSKRIPSLKFKRYFGHNKHSRRFPCSFWKGFIF